MSEYVITICQNCGLLKIESISEYFGHCDLCGHAVISTGVDPDELCTLSDADRETWKKEIRQKFAPDYKQQMKQAQSSISERTSSLQKYSPKNVFKMFFLSLLYALFHRLSEDSFITLNTSHHSYSHNCRTERSTNTSSSIKSFSGGSTHQYNNTSKFSSGGGLRGGGAGRRK